MDKTLLNSRILLIDDNSIDNFISKKILEKYGFKNSIEAKTSGQAALKFLQENSSDPEKLPNIIFLDINMPVIDGFMFLYEYEKLPLNVKFKCKIIILSSSDNQKDIKRIVDNQFVRGFITKPLSIDALKEISPSLTINFETKKAYLGKQASISL
jgi:CheY-like chemotaxis protein